MGSKPMNGQTDEGPPSKFIHTFYAHFHQTVSRSIKATLLIKMVRLYVSIELVDSSLSHELLICTTRLFFFSKLGNHLGMFDRHKVYQHFIIYQSASSCASKQNMCFKKE